jgi:tetratricopeptide (TPR) repeat protein
MSVYEESAPRLELDRMFVTAVAGNGLIKVSDMNRQMSRPTVPANALLSYYQAARICDYVFAKHGMEGMKKLLAEVRAGRKIEDAIKSALGCTMAEFEAGALEHQRAFAAANIRQTAQVDQAMITKLLVEVQARPEDPAALVALAWAYASPEVRRFDGAKKRAEETLKFVKEGDGKLAGKAHAVLGIVAVEKDKNYREARAHFERAVAADPDNPEARFHLGRIANLEGDWKGAVEQLERARAISPRWASGTNTPYDELGKSYAGLGDKEKSLEVLRARVAMDKFALDPALALARQALAAGKPELAEWACWQAVKFDPFKAEPHLLWGQAAEKSKHPADAEREYRLAARAEATNLDSRLGLARVLWAAGRKEEAKQAVAEAKALDAEMPEVKELVKTIGLPDAAAPAPTTEQPKPGDKPAEKKPEPPKAEDKPAPPEPERGEVPKLEKVKE